MSNSPPPAPKTYFEEQRAHLVSQITVAMDLVLNNLNALNRSLESVTAVGKEFESVENLWSEFEKVMNRDEEAAAEEGQQSR